MIRLLSYAIQIVLYTIILLLLFYYFSNIVVVTKTVLTVNCIQSHETELCSLIAKLKLKYLRLGVHSKYYTFDTTCITNIHLSKVVL